MYVMFPSEKEWKQIEQNTPFKGFSFSTSDFLYPNNTVESLLDNQILDEVVKQLIHRVIDLNRSYILSTYYFNLGISDEEWIDKKGLNFYPNFEKKDFYLKSMFDYFTNSYYYNLFSCWETIGHYINIKYNFNFNINQVSFKKIVYKIENIDKLLYEKLSGILNAPEFEESRNIRNDIAHNFFPNKPGIIRRRDKNGVLVEGINKYRTSKEIENNIELTIKLIIKTINILRDRIKSRT